MKVNSDKTHLLVVSDALSFKPGAYIRDGDDREIESTDSMRILGFHFSSRPTVAAHVEALRRRFRQKYWILFHLKNFGFTKEELAKVYRTIILPTADYCSVVYHAMLTDEQDEVLDRCQAHALRCIYGKGVSYEKMRAMAGVKTLRQRRIEACDRFAAKCLKDPRFSHWFPLRENIRSTSRNAEKYLEVFVRCDRLKNTPCFS